ncbi:MAG: hypothetical protein KTR26_10715 [Flammeovirgaceae bacterium]|nr:hypothetical protein [Flammeovirgaceae bacterium]
MSKKNSIVQFKGLFLIGLVLLLVFSNNFAVHSSNFPSQSESSECHNDDSCPVEDGAAYFENNIVLNTVNGVVHVDFNKNLCLLPAMVRPMVVINQPKEKSLNPSLLYYFHNVLLFYIAPHAP